MSKHILSNIHPSDRDTEPEVGIINKRPARFLFDRSSHGVVPGTLKVWIGGTGAEFVDVGRPPDFYEGDGRLIVEHTTGIVTFPLDALNAALGVAAADDSEKHDPSII